MANDNYLIFSQAIDRSYVRNIARLIAPMVRRLAIEKFSSIDSEPNDAIFSFFQEVLRASGTWSEKVSPDQFVELLINWAKVREGTGSGKHALETLYYLYTISPGQMIVRSVEENVFKKSFAELAGFAVPGRYQDEYSHHRSEQKEIIDLLNKINAPKDRQLISPDTKYASYLDAVVEKDYEIYESQSTVRAPRSLGFSVDDHSYDEGEREACRRIEEEYELRSGVLDLGRLKISCIPKEVRKLKWLRRLDGFKSKIMSFSGLEDMHQLEVLLFSGGRIDTLRHLRDCINLRYICLESCPIVRLDGIEGCTLLQFLDLDGTDVYDLGPLRRLKNLRTLFLSHRVENLDDVPSLPKLRKMTWGYKTFEGPFRM